VKIAWGHRRAIASLLVASVSICGAISACTDSYRSDLSGSSGTGGAGGATTASGTGGFDVNVGGGEPCNATCANDLKSVVNCKGVVLTQCTVDQGCANGQCIDNPCKAAELSKSSYGCDYWALKTALRPQADGACFAAFIANTWEKPVKITVERNGQTLPVANFARIPQGQGQAITYAPYDANAGLGIGEMAILFLSRDPNGNVVNCPAPAALAQETGVTGTGIGQAFHISTDYPVVAYQILPYGGGQAGVTSATLLLPTSAWDTNYMAINAYKASAVVQEGFPSLAVLAHQDNTEVTILPKVDIQPGTNVAGAMAGMPAKYTLNAGQFLQITQTEELTGSPIQSNNPVAVFGASTCMSVPSMQNGCDSAQQQLAPIKALGNEYAAVRYKSRSASEEAPPWRVVGAVDSTTLTWEPSTPPGAPKTLALGQVVEFSATGPFVVKSQDADHPFYVGQYMTGGSPFSADPNLGIGDPDWVNVIPPSQYLTRYVLFADPTYPETSLVVIRTPSKVDGSFADVELDCAGKLSGWKSLGKYEYTRVDLVTGDFMNVGNCSNGRREMWSDLPFGVTVWGWGTTQLTANVSYAYPAGAGFQPINQVVVPPVPK